MSASLSGDAFRRISERLLAVSSEDSDREIEASLAELAGLVGAARVYVFLLDEDGGALDRAHEWCAPGIPGHDFSCFAGLPVTTFLWTLDQLRADQHVYVANTKMLPEEAVAEREACRALSIGAYVNLPLWLEERLIGWLGFDVDHPEPGWEEADFMLMRAAGRMLAFTLDRLAREARLREEQALHRRLMAIGTLAAGVGHEINNPLSFVDLNLRELREGLQRSESARDREHLELVEDALQGVATIAETVRTLRAFARPPSGQGIGVTPVAEAVAQTRKLLAPSLTDDSELLVEVDPDLHVAAGPADLGHLLTNVLQNALDAMHGTGGRSLAVRARRDGDAVRVVVEDDGPGFAPDVRPRVFEPFFTTRAALGGSGIGLALCDRIVRRLGGTIEADNRPEGGARVTVTLPAATPVEAPSELERPPLAREGRARVLVVDDLIPLRRALARQLRRHYEVDTAGSGNEVIARCRQGETWDAIVCDVLMPDGSGHDVYAYLVRERPALASRLLFLSGGDRVHTASGLLERYPNRLLEKPADPDTLLAAIEEIVSAAPASCPNGQ